MREDVLYKFFAGRVSAADLEADAKGMRMHDGPRDGPHVYRYQITPMTGEFALRSEHVAKLLDAAINGELAVDTVHLVFDWLDGGNERLHWDASTPDGKRVADALFWLGNPEINYPLTQHVLMKIRLYLISGEHTLTAVDARLPRPNAAGS